VTTLDLDQVTVRAGRATLLDGVSLSLAAGELVALVGPNGAGKTSLLRTALGLLRPSAGKVMLGGRAVGALRGRERAAAAAWLSQHGVVLEDLTAIELVAAARFRFHEGRAATLAAARRALARVGATAWSDRIVRQLSGGEQQRVAFACLLAQEAPLLLLDEPANHLDPAQQIALYTLIGELWREGRGVLCVTHDVNLLAHAAHGRDAEIRVAGMHGGHLSFSSPLDDPGLGAALSRIFGVRIEALAHAGRRVFVASESEHGP
jgi:iron complex transport system ATP-binding protein